MRILKYALVFIAFMPTISMNANDEAKGVDPKNLDLTVKPGEDFYNFACGGWMKNNPIEAQYSRFGTFDQLGENNRKQVKDLIQNLSKQKNANGSLAQKIGDLYMLGMDSIRLNKEGSASINEDLMVFEKAKRNDFTALIAKSHSGIGSPFFGIGIMSDLKNSNVNAMYLSQSGMALGDRDYYLNSDANTKKIQKAYMKYLEDLFTLAGYKSARAKKAAKNVMSVETELAKVAMSREEQRDYSTQYNKRSIADLKKKYSNIDWDVYLKGINLPQVDTVIVSQLKTLEKVNSMLKEFPEESIKDYLAYNYLGTAANYLSDSFVNNEFEMFSKALSGKKEQQPRWKRAVSVPNGLLGEAVGELYVEKYFPAQSKARMLKLVGNLKKSLADHIANLSWMSDTTKINALVKLNSVNVKIGYPDKWRDYTGMTIDPSQSYWANIKKAIEFETAYQFSKYGKPVDKDEWGMTPQTVNAYYDPTANEICFPAGILQAPFFDANADDASNYGAIGVVIGHEMTHGFDDQGRNFDQNGNMKEWWTKKDADKFKTLTDKLVSQFNDVKVLGDTHANGAFTLGENIADQGGLNVSYSAFLNTDEGRTTKKTDGFTPAQRFFLSYANVWAANIRDEEILRRTKIDPHSLGRWRVNATLKNINPFYEAFKITSNEPMYLAPESRVTIW